MNELMKRFHSLSEREQKLVMLTGIVVVVALFYWVIWQPIANGLVNEEARYTSQQSTLTWVQEQSVKAQQLRRSAGKSAQFRGSLPQAVNQTSGQFDVPISRMQPQGDELLVWVDQAPFDQVVAWLNALEEKGIVILQADMAEADLTGHVKIRRLQLGKP